MNFCGIYKQWLLPQRGTDITYLEKLQLYVSIEIYTWGIDNIIELIMLVKAVYKSSQDYAVGVCRDGLELFHHNFINMKRYISKTNSHALLYSRQQNYSSIWDNICQKTHY